MSESEVGGQLMGYVGGSGVSHTTVWESMRASHTHTHTHVATDGLTL